MQESLIDVIEILSASFVELNSSMLEGVSFAIPFKAVAKNNLNTIGVTSLSAFGKRTPKGWVVSNISSDFGHDLSMVNVTLKSKLESFLNKNYMEG